MNVEVTIFEREELIKIKERALVLSGVKGVNPSWRRAFYNLATAADHLDAMIARSTVEENVDRQALSTPELEL
jgi:hypothetical protein